MKKFLVSTALVGAAVAATVIWWKRSAPSPDLWEGLDDPTWPSVSPSFAETPVVAPAIAAQEDSEVAPAKPKRKRSPKKVAEPEAEAS